MKKLLAFDLDDTLAITKSPISDEMSEVLGKIIEEFEICIISGGRYEQFKEQVIDRLHIEPHKLNRLHLMPKSVALVTTAIMSLKLNGSSSMQKILLTNRRVLWLRFLRNLLRN